MQSPANKNRTKIIPPIGRLLVALSLVTLVGCLDKNTTDSASDTGSGNQSHTEAQGGDDYWAELAQNYQPFVRPPDLGAAYGPTDWINVGSWEPTFDWPVIATAAANLPDGRIVAWSSQEVDNFGGPLESTLGTIYNPDTGVFEEHNSSSHDMFCAGVSMLEDGRVFIAGGGRTVSTTSVFDTNEFTEIEPMAMTRWYPSSTTLASGQVFTSLGTTASPYPEIWTDGKGWSLLPKVNLQTILDGEDVIHQDWYPAFNVAPDGSLFHPGHMPDILSVYMKQDDAVHDHGKRSTDEASRLYNTTVMYDIGKMLVAGGGEGDNATNSALTMDVNGPSPIITPTNPMTYVRSMQNSVVLPNGEVLVIGGNSSGIQFSDDGTVLEPEIWNPQTEQWRVLAPHDKPRNYHSIAMLLKDGRVLSAGGGLCGECPTNHQNGEIYSPPYLFDATGAPAARPSITSGNPNALPGDTISLTGSDDIVKFNMLRLVAITHHHSTDQRMVPVDSIKTGVGTYDLTLNDNPNVLVPGYYWIFGLNDNGTPTIGHTIQINVTPENQPDTSVDTSPNIAYEYFEEILPVWELPDFDTLTPVKTGTQPDFSLANKERNNNYSFRFRGTITAPVTGEYTFYLSSDDGSKLLINNQTIVDHDGVHAFEMEQSGSVNLTAGEHDIEVQYFEISGGDALLASWDGPGFDKRPIQAFDLGSPLPAPDFQNTNPGPSIPGMVSYRYFEGQWNNLPDFSNETLIKEGEVAGFDLSPREAFDFYGFEFTANITVDQSGDYTFYTLSDDGSRLSIDGVTIVNNDGRHAPREQSGTMSLSAGTHQLKVDFFEYAGGDILEVQWSGPSLAKQTISNAVLASNGSVEATNNPDPGPATDPEPDTGTTGIINYQYYEGTWNNLPNFSNLTPLKQGQSAGFLLTERMRDDFYGMRYTGKITVPTSGNYTFYAKSDDGSRISINGQIVVTNDGRHAPIEKQGGIALAAGQHDIIVDFFEYAGGDSLEVSWAGPGISKQAVPVSALATGSTGNNPDPDPIPDPDPTPNGNGLVNYQYFEGQWSTLPNFDLLVAVKEGTQTGFSLAPSDVNDHYAFRFATYLNVPADGLYSFYLASDDGSRLTIDGELLIDNDGFHANRELNASTFLTAGNHHILVEYFEGAGFDTLSVEWSAAGLAKQALASAELSSAPFDYAGNPSSPVNPNPNPDPVPGKPTTDTDLKFEYYEGSWTSLPAFDLLTPISVGNIAQFTLPPSNGVLFYAYRFSGQIYIDEQDIYTFYTASNDGSQLRIDGVLVVDNNGKHGVLEKQGSIELSPGLHDIEVTYFQSNGTEALNVYWSDSNSPKRIIDSTDLFSP